MRSYPFPDQNGGFRPKTKMDDCNIIETIYIVCFCFIWDGLGGFGESKPDSPNLNGPWRRGRKPRIWGFLDPPPFFENRGGKKRVKKSLRPTSVVRLSFYGIGRGEKSGGGGSHGASSRPRWGGTPPPVSKIDGIYSRA